MSQHYSNPSRESDPHALPNIEVFELTASEVARMSEDDIHEFWRRHEFRLAHMNGRVFDRMIDAIIDETGVTGGWFWQSCFPGCLPDSDPIGPFETHAEALADAQSCEGDDNYEAPDGLLDPHDPYSYADVTIGQTQPTEG